LGIYQDNILRYLSTYFLLNLN